MKKSLVLAMAMAMGVTASAYAANPFSDVPAGHWAYDAVAQLEAAGVVEGYGSTFGGDKLMTRYEMAQIVAKAMAKGASCDKLAAEFADELDALGVRVAKLEKKVDNVKITGQIRYSYKDSSDKGTGNSGHGKNYNRFRTRLFVSGAINNNWTYTGMLENNRFLDNSSGGDKDDVNLRRAYVDGRIGGLKVRGGRMYFTYASQYDDRLDGVQLSYKFGKVNVTGLAAKNLAVGKSYTAKNLEDNDRLYAVIVGGKFGKLEADVSYWKSDMGGYDDEIWGAKLGYPVAKDLKLTGEVFIGDNDRTGKYASYDDSFGYEVRLAYRGAKASKPGTWGLFAGYQDRPFSTYLCPAVLNTWADNPSNINDDGDGFKGWDVGANYAFAKNIVGSVRYFSYKARENAHGTTNTIWGDVTFSF